MPEFFESSSQVSVRWRCWFGLLFPGTKVTAKSKIGKTNEPARHGYRATSACSTGIGDRAPNPPGLEPESSVLRGCIFNTSREYLESLVCAPCPFCRALLGAWCLHCSYHPNDRSHVGMNLFRCWRIRTNADMMVFMCLGEGYCGIKMNFKWKFAHHEEVLSKEGNYGYFEEDFLCHLYFFESSFGERNYGGNYGNILFKV